MSSTRSCSRRATRCRSASSASSSTRPPRTDPASCAPDHRGRRALARRGLPGRHDLQGPLPRGRGAGHPERTGSGYRRYSAEDVERLRYVLRAQRDLFWPLKVIREALEAIDRGLEPTGPDQRPEVPDPGPDPDVPSRPDAGPLLAGRAVRLTAPSSPAPRGSPRTPSASCSTTGCCARARTGCTTRRTCAPPGPPRGWPATDSRPGTCASSGPPPTARSGSSSRPPERCADPTPAGPPTRSPTSSWPSTRHWSAVASAPAADHPPGRGGAGVR
ncbi:MerR family transcriptional regulator [Phycicoccus sp. HDW14]|uniref:MerR family transcriptional regulator n=1 Tax=Phycicoccus sp. HDW14 TaxID=2714941 RepID=UPI001F116D29